MRTTKPVISQPNLDVSYCAVESRLEVEFDWAGVNGLNVLKQ